jgi:hypothetical protein
MFNEIYVAIQQGQVLQHRWLEEACQARRGWFATRMRRTLASNSPRHKHIAFNRWARSGTWPTAFTEDT